MAPKLQSQCDTHHTTEITLEMSSFYVIITINALSRRSGVQVQAQAKFFLLSSFSTWYKKPKVKKTIALPNARGTTTSERDPLHTAMSADPAASGHFPSRLPGMQPTDIHLRSFVCCPLFAPAQLEISSQSTPDIILVRHSPARGGRVQVDY